MDRKRFLAMSAAALAVSLTFAACGSRAEQSGTGGDGGASVVKIGVIVPLSGDLSAMGLGIKNSVAVAIRQANDSGAVPGVRFELAAEDDQAQPDTGRNAATKLAGDPDVLGVVGPLNSSVGQSIQPVLDGADIPLVSPANTNPALTRGAAFDTAPKRTYATYFRTCATDSVQGPFAADYLIEKGIKKVATVHDKKSYGQGLVTAFTKHFIEKGGTIVAAQTINPDDKDFGAVITDVKAKAPQAVYYGGEYPQAGPLASQMKSAGLAVPLMGGDGIFDPTFIELARDGAPGDLATSVGAPVETLPSAKAFVEAYRASGADVSDGAYGAYAYDAANAIIRAAKVSLATTKNAEDARKATVEALGSVSFDGATGKVAFDEYGDAKTRLLTVYEVDKTAWKAVKSGELG